MPRNACPATTLSATNRIAANRIATVEARMRVIADAIAYSPFLESTTTALANSHTAIREAE